MKRSGKYKLLKNINVDTDAGGSAMALPGLRPRELKRNVTKINKSCRRTASSPAGYILYCNIFIIKPYNIGHTDLDVFVCKSFCHIDIIIQV